MIASFIPLQNPLNRLQGISGEPVGSSGSTVFQLSSSEFPKLPGDRTPGWIVSEILGSTPMKGELLPPTSPGAMPKFQPEPGTIGNVLKGLKDNSFF
jgi:hypothetical protein